MQVALAAGAQRGRLLALRPCQLLGGSRLHLGRRRRGGLAIPARRRGRAGQVEMVRFRETCAGQQGRRQSSFCSIAAAAFVTARKEPLSLHTDTRQPLRARNHAVGQEGRSLPGRMGSIIMARRSASQPTASGCPQVSRSPDHASHCKRHAQQLAMRGCVPQEQPASQQHQYRLGVAQHLQRRRIAHAGLDMRQPVRTVVAAGAITAGAGVFRPPACTQ
jgi:hypothetical protein